MSALEELVRHYPVEGEEDAVMQASAAAELAASQKRLEEADENLLSMVNQYCVRRVDEDGRPKTYSHDFMSAGEAAFEYLTKHGLAEWCENGFDICDLKFLRGEEMTNCQCITCRECEGTGTVWRSISGVYLGSHRYDDMDELEPCESCNGSGIFIICDTCQVLREKEDEN